MKKTVADPRGNIIQYNISITRLSGVSYVSNFEVTRT